MLDETNGAVIGPDDDGALVLRVRAGELDAYAELVRRHAPMAVRLAALLGAGSDAEDVVQEALVKAYRSLGRFRDGASFRPWLLRIVANEAHNHNRSAVRRGARERAAMSDPDGSADPLDAVADSESRERLLVAVRRLPEHLRRVVICRYLLELDEAETAAVLGVPRGTVKSRLSRSLARLRDDLTEDATAVAGTRKAGHV